MAGTYNEGDPCGARSPMGASLRNWFELGGTTSNVLAVGRRLDPDFLVLWSPMMEGHSRDGDTSSRGG